MTISYPVQWNAPAVKETLAILRFIDEPSRHRMIVENAGLPTAKVRWEGTLEDRWRSTLAVAAETGAVPALLAAVAEDIPVLKDRIDKILAMAPETASGVGPTTPSPEIGSVAASFKHLDDDTLDRVTAAILDLGLAEDIRAMTAGIPQAFVASAVTGGTPAARVMTLADKMNSTPRLVTGEVPIKSWLKNCAKLAAGAPEANVFLQALEQLCADGSTAYVTDVSAVPKGKDGQLEMTIVEDDTLPVSFLVRGAEASRSVAKLQVHRHFDEKPEYLAGGKPAFGLGTGWLIAPSLVMTNHHVIAARDNGEPEATSTDFICQAAATTVLFDYVDDGVPAREIHTEGCVASDSQLDFALLRISPAATDRPPLALRKVPLIRAKASGLKDRVNLLQHPDGHPMRLGFRNNFVVAGSDERLSYLTDTKGGSSGSPICDDEWFVVGLHRGWTMIKDGPVMVWGRAIRQENFGTPIARILAHIGLQNPELHAEIESAQSALTNGT